MSGLFNIRVGGVEAEDIICDGQTVEEVWVDGVQVFDAYDPEAVPNGTLSFAGYNGVWPGNYNQGRQDFIRRASGQAGATGSISLSTGAASEYYYWENMDRNSGGIATSTYYDFTGNEVGWSSSVYTTLSLCYPNGSPLFTIHSEDECGPYANGDSMRANSETIVSSSDNIHGTKQATITWNFKTRKYTVSGNNGFVTVTRDFSDKWKPGMYVLLERGYSSTSGWYCYHNGQIEQTYDNYTNSNLHPIVSN